MSISSIGSSSVNPLFSDDNADSYDAEKIFEAIKSNDVEKVRILISENSNYVHAKEKFYNATPLHHAVSVNANEEIVKLLINAGADIDAEDEEGRTSLHWAALLGEVNMIEILVGIGADINAPDNEGRTPLYTAVIYDKEAAVEKLINLRADGNILNKSGETPMHLAIGKTSRSIVKLLAKANLQFVDAQGRTPLHLVALEYGFCELVDIAQDLIEMDVNIDARDKEGRTPLHLAIKIDFEKMKKKIEFKKRHNLTSEDLIRAEKTVFCFYQISLVKLLIKEKANINIQDNEGKTPLHYAIEDNFELAEEKLLEAGANL